MDVSQIASTYIKKNKDGERIAVAVLFDGRKISRKMKHINQYTYKIKLSK